MLWATVREKSSRESFFTGREGVMNGFNLVRIVVAVAVATALSAGCAGSRGGGCRGGSCRASSATESPPPNRSEATHARVLNDAPRGLAQQTCPVTGEELGSMGPPIPVNVKGRTIQVCCDGCVAAVRKNPDKYLKIVDDELSSSPVPAAQRSNVEDRAPPSSHGVEGASTHHH